MLEAAQRASGLNPGRARALLGRFLFSGEDAEKPLERALRRRAPAPVAGAARGLGEPPPNVLILDEPTNHLDIESREALEDALRSFQGAILLVSHDRALLDAVGTRTIAVEDGSLHSYVGGWAEYVRMRDERAGGRVGSGPARARGTSRLAALAARRRQRSRARGPGRHAARRPRTAPAARPREAEVEAQSPRGRRRTA